MNLREATQKANEASTQVLRDWVATDEPTHDELRDLMEVLLGQSFEAFRAGQALPDGVRALGNELMAKLAATHTDECVHLDGTPFEDKGELTEADGEAAVDEVTKLLGL